MNIGIVGSRTFDDYGCLVYVVSRHISHDVPSLKDEITIISGEAIGADSLAKRFAKKHSYNYLEFPADWDKYGKSAGYRRNIDIVNNSDIVIAFWDGESKGTKHTIDLANKVCKRCYVYTEWSK